MGIWQLYAWVSAKNKDGTQCSGCTLVSYKSENVVFVSGIQFSSFLCKDINLCNRMKNEGEATMVVKELSTQEDQIASPSDHQDNLN